MASFPSNSTRRRPPGGRVGALASGSSPSENRRVASARPWELALAFAISTKADSPPSGANRTSLKSRPACPDDGGAEASGEPGADEAAPDGEGGTGELHALANSTIASVP